MKIETNTWKTFSAQYLMERQKKKYLFEAYLWGNLNKTLNKQNYRNSNNS
jgi:hypothetical protein